MEKFDVLVIGGGPAGMMAALSASKNNKKVAIIEKNNLLGKKLLMTGDGRCNITNENFNKKETARLLGKDGDFLLSALSRYGLKETINFFEENGLKLEKQENGKYFPLSNRSKDVLDFLINQLKKEKIKIFNNRKVLEIKRKGRNITKIILNEKKELSADNYIIATGGKSYPITGSTGDGYIWARSLGHTIEEPRPALCPIQVKEEWVKELSGLSFDNIELSILINEKTFKKYKGDILFAHFGLTGPLILDISGELGELIKKQKVKISIDLFPNKTKEKLEKEISKLIEINRNRKIQNVLFVPQRLIPYILNFSKVDPKKKCNELLKEERQGIINVLKRITLRPIGLLGFDKAMVTKGGVCLKEIDSKTMKSKLIDNLFFAGEIIDLHGPCGGYNLQICWTTGCVAGQNA
jgi:predicted Rossmann fold flavoprotein